MGAVILSLPKRTGLLQNLSPPHKISLLLRIVVLIRKRPSPGEDPIEILPALILAIRSKYRKPMNPDHFGESATAIFNPMGVL